MRNFKRVFILGVLTLCVASAQMAHAASSQARQTQAEKIKAHMIENYLLWQIAVKIGDADRIISFESPEFTHVMQDGTVRSKSEADAATRLWTSRLRKVHNARVYIKKIDIEPHRIVIWSERELDADMVAGTDPNDNRLRRIRFFGTTRDTWVQYDNNWVLKRIQNLTAKASIDGKPVPLNN